MRTTVVVPIDEVVEQLLELGNCGWLSRLGAEPLLEGLLKRSTSPGVIQREEGGIVRVSFARSGHLHREVQRHEWALGPVPQTCGKSVMLR